MMGIENATHIEVEADVRYWEDAVVNGIEDESGDLIPGKDGDTWKVKINLESGAIVNWPAKTEANIHYKVCDAGLYWLTDDDGKRVAKWRGDYVPDDFLCHGYNGYGDYIIMHVGSDGTIDGYSQPFIDEGQWEALP